MKIFAPLLLLLLSGCHRTAEFAGPAPAGALECASAHALAAGYQMIDGSLDERFVRLVQLVRETPAEARPTRPTSDLGDAALGNGTDSPIRNEILAELDGGTLRLSVLANSDAGGGDGDGSNAEELARSMLALCTATPPVFPEGAEPGEPSPSAEPL